MMTRRDPVVEEVRKHREEIAREHGNDLDAIVAAFQREDAADVDRVTVSLPARRVVKPHSRLKPQAPRRHKRLDRPAARQER